MTSVSFLNDIESYAYDLVNNGTTKKFLAHPKRMEGMKSIILYGNELLYLDLISEMIIKGYYNLGILHLHKADDYEYSDYHFDLHYSDQTIKFIKEIVKNKSVSNRPFIFVIRGVEEVKKQLPLKHLIDYQGGAQFIFLMRNLGRVDRTILSRSTLINCSFNANAARLASNKIVVFQRLEELLILMKKENRITIVIEAIREFIYKVYHMCIPLTMLSKYIIKTYDHHERSRDIVELAAGCDISGDCILVYEKFFLGLVKLL